MPSITSCNQYDKYLHFIKWIYSDNIANMIVKIWQIKEFEPYDKETHAVQRFSIYAAVIASIEILESFVKIIPKMNYGIIRV